MEDIICQHCGTVNDYYTERSGKHLKATCNNCNKYIKFLRQVKEPTFYFGKYKGRTIASLTTEDEIKYLQWAFQNMDKLTSVQRSAIDEHLSKLNRNV